MMPLQLLTANSAERVHPGTTVRWWADFAGHRKPAPAMDRLFVHVLTVVALEALCTVEWLFGAAPEVFETGLAQSLILRCWVGIPDTVGALGPNA